jgi:hypothetical protein
MNRYCRCNGASLLVEPIQFRYWQGTNPFSTLAVTCDGVGLSRHPALAFGTYNYEIRYVANGQSVPYVVGTGTSDVFGMPRAVRPRSP